MPSTHGTYNDGHAEEIRKAVEDARAQYEWRRFVEVMQNAEISLAVAKALDAMEDESY